MSKSAKESLALRKSLYASIPKEKVDMVVADLKRGISTNTAVGVAEIPKTTYSEWRKKINKKVKEFQSCVDSEKEGTPRMYPEITEEEWYFWDQILLGEALYKKHHEDVIVRSGNWKGSAWLLERKFAEEYKINNEINLTSHNTNMNATTEISEVERKDIMTEITKFIGGEVNYADLKEPIEED